MAEMIYVLPEGGEIRMSWPTHIDPESFSDIMRAIELQMKIVRRQMIRKAQTAEIEVYYGA